MGSPRQATPLSTRIQSSPEPIYEHGYWGSDAHKEPFPINISVAKSPHIFQNIYVFTYQLIIPDNSRHNKTKQNFFKQHPGRFKPVDKCSLDGRLPRNDVRLF